MDGGGGWMRKRIVAAIVVGLAALGPLPQGARAASPATGFDAAEARAWRQMEMMVFRIRMFHHEARSSIIASLELPIFRDYFLLPESATDRYDQSGVLLVTPMQAEVRRRIEDWAVHLHKRFPIAETCLVDRQGQEHMRVAGGVIAPPEQFSRDEQETPFFKPAFALDRGQVHMTAPYLSTDANQWVVAFTAPVVTAGGAKPAFFHYEILLNIYQNIVKTRDFGFSSAHKVTVDPEEEGRYFILDEEGLVLADSRHPVPLAPKPGRKTRGERPERLADILPKVASISDDPAIREAFEAMRKGEKGARRIEAKSGRWVLVFQPIPDRPWILGHLDPVGR